jgi:peroxiredoxin Q/BCP
MYKFIVSFIKWPAAAIFMVSAMFGQIVAALETGDKAPDFSLSASDGNTYTLSQFKGVKPVVIAFFPKAFTGG